MDESRIESATRRIEAALARIAAASETLEPRSGPTGEAAGVDDAASDQAAADLAARHENLRGSVEASLRDLDELIGRLER